MPSCFQNEPTVNPRRVFPSQCLVYYGAFHFYLRALTLGGFLETAYLQNIYGDAKISPINTQEQNQYNCKALAL